MAPVVVIAIVKSRTARSRRLPPKLRADNTHLSPNDNIVNEQWKKLA